MSSVGQAVGGVVGAIVGFYAGNPVLGAQIGMMIGGAIDPPKGPTINGPRLTDLSVQTSTYGAFIPRNYGTMAQNGNVFWVQGDKLIEVITPTSSGGKGAPKTTTNTASYYATFAVGLCEGPIDGVRRIWIGNQLWYDAGSNDLATIVASNQNASQFTLYPGTDTQSPDPLIQADKGIANVPAYRGLAYIVFDRLPLAAYSNSILGAQVKAEIVKLGTNDFTTQSVVMRNATWGAVSWNGSAFVAVEDGGTGVAVSYDGQNWTDSVMPSGNWESITYGVTVNGLALYCTVSVTNYPNNVAISSDGISWTAYAMPSANAWSSVANLNGIFCAVSTNSVHGSPVAYSSDATIWTESSMPVAASWNAITASDTVFCAVSNGTTCAVSADGLNWTAGSMPVSANWSDVIWNGSVFCAVSHDSNDSATSVDGLTWTAGGALPYASGWKSVAWNGKEFLAVNNVSNMIGASSADGAVWAALTLPNEPWNDVVNAGGIFFALTHDNISSNSAFIYRNQLSSTVVLGDIVQAECLTSQLLTAGDLDVTDLVDTVRGYRVTKLGAIRGAIDPLRAAFPFDVVQHGYQIKFKRRGSASVATIASTELDARAAGDAPGVQITTVREMDSVLPRRVSVSYVDVTREYDINQQYFQRLNTDAVSEKSIDLPIVFNATEAIQKAETLLYMYWLERYDVSLRLPPTYAQLEPGDVITVTSPAADYELRLTSVNTLPDGRLECAAKFNQAALYTPTAIGEEGSSTGNTMSISGAALYRLLDIPLVRDQDDMAGFPVAMSGYLSGWPGGILYRSDDGGQSWIDLQAFSSGATIGYAPTVLSGYGSTVYDLSGTLTVKLYCGSLASVSESQMFAGQNWFAYGVDGRWEIIAARNAVLQGDGSYMLSDFLRGQQGTEWASGLHAANDHIVLLETAYLDFVSVNSSIIGSARNYRAITLGKTLDSDASQSFTYNGVNLECLSPVNLTGSRDFSSGDWTLTWTRRSRFSGWRDYVDAPLGETTASYEIDIYSDGTYTTVKRTIASASESISYTGAQQVTDFGWLQPIVYVKAYQLSATVGRGYPLTGSVDRTATYSRDWNDGSINGQSLFGNAGAAQAVVAQQITLASAASTDAKIRLDEINSCKDFDFTVDIICPPAGEESGVVFGTSYWGNANDTYAYLVNLSTSGITLAKGSNSAVGSYTVIYSAGIGYIAGTSYALRVRKRGSLIEGWIDGVQRVNSTDSTFTAAGQIGLRVFNATTAAAFDNLQISY